MKALFTQAALLLMALTAYAQVKFERGYFVKNDGSRVECLIKNPDWSYNPEHFEYKLTDNDELHVTGLSHVTEFGSADGKYIRVVTEIDKEPQLTFSRAPKLITDTVFLKVLVEGKARLLQFSNNDGKKFFVGIEDQPIRQLIYRKYLVKPRMRSENGQEIVDESTTLQNVNVTYQQQLFNEVACGDIDTREVKRVAYSREDLIAYVNRYNTCSDPAYQVQTPVKDKDHIQVHIKVTPGVDFATLVVSNETAQLPIADLGEKTNFRIGLEAEFVLPIHRKKWSLLAEPAFQNYKGSLNTTANPPPALIYADYRSVELGFGIRYYTYLKETTMFFIDVIGFRDFDTNSTFVSNYYHKELNPSGRFNYAFGAGIQFRRFSIEGRMYSSRNVFGNFPPWVADYEKKSVIFGYRLR